MTQQPRTRLNVPMLIGLLAAIVIPACGLYAFLQYANERGAISKGISNTRQIVTALRISAMDHNGKYPDTFLTSPQSSNEVFRVLLKEKVVEDEMIFGSFVSPYNPDGNIGTAPDFANALEAGENHWAMTAGLSESAPEDIPLVYENPVTASWPPKWNSRAARKSVSGRPWAPGVIVGLNDSSFTVLPLESGKGTAAGLAKGWDGKDPFGRAIDPVKFPKGVVLDVLKNAE